MSLFNLSGAIEVGGTVLSLLPSGPQNRFSSGATAITIQATLEEVHSANIEVTEHPVQTGAAITDHSYNRPVELMLRCAWSNSTLEGLYGAAQNLKAMLQGSVSAPSYVASIYSQLVALKEARVPMDIVTSLMLYKNMLITGISITRDVKSSQALMCSISCKQVILVDVLSGSVSTTNQTVPQTTGEPLALGPQNLLGSGTLSAATTNIPTAGWMSFP